MAHLVTELTTGFKRGMMDSVAAPAFPQDAVELIRNGRILPDETVETRGGTRRKHPVSLGAVGYGAFEARFPDGTKHMLVFVDDTVFKSTNGGASWTDLTASLTLAKEYWTFATMKVGASFYVFCANGGVIYRYDGTEVKALTGSPSVVKYVAVFNDRLAAWGTGLLQLSAVGDPTNWTVPHGLAVTVQTHDGDTPTGLFQSGPYLYAFKRESLSYIDGFGESTLVVAAGSVGVSRSVGCIAHRTIVAVGDDAFCWLSDRGIEHFSPSTGVQLRSQNLQQFFRDMDRKIIEGNPGSPVAAYDPATQRYHLALPYGGTENNRTVVLDLVGGGLTVDDTDTPPGEEPIRFMVQPDGVLVATDDLSGYLPMAEPDTGAFGLAIFPSEVGQLLKINEDGDLEELIIGSLPATLFSADDELGRRVVHSIGYDGFVRIHGVGSRDDQLSDGTGGSPITFTLRSRPFFFRALRNRKRVRSVHVVTLNSVPATLSVGVRADNEFVPQSMTVPGGGGRGVRRKFLVSARSDAPQVELSTTDTVRVAAIGVSASILAEVP